MTDQLRRNEGRQSDPGAAETGCGQILVGVDAREDRFLERIAGAGHRLFAIVAEGRELRKSGAVTITVSLSSAISVIG